MKSPVKERIDKLKAEIELAESNLSTNFKKLNPTKLLPSKASIEELSLLNLLSPKPVMDLLSSGSSSNLSDDKINPNKLKNIFRILSTLFRIFK